MKGAGALAAAAALAPNKTLAGKPEDLKTMMEKRRLESAENIDNENEKIKLKVGLLQKFRDEHAHEIARSVPPPISKLTREYYESLVKMGSVALSVGAIAGGAAAAAAESALRAKEERVIVSEEEQKTPIETGSKVAGVGALAGAAIGSIAYAMQPDYKNLMEAEGEVRKWVLDLILKKKTSSVSEIRKTIDDEIERLKTTFEGNERELAMLQ